MAQTCMAKKAAMSGGEDRVSALPDGLLEDLLGFLPADEAVRTSVLARRWRHLWRSMRRLRVTDSSRFLICRGPLVFRSFMDGLLLFRNTVVALDEVKFRVCAFEDDTCISNWIRHVLLCKTQVLAIDFPYFSSLKLDGPPLVAQHLRRLELVNVILMGDILDFSSCPALEDLKMTECYLLTVRVVSQSVKHLTIRKSSSFPNLIHISTSSLISLELDDFDGKVHLAENMPSLKTAWIKPGLLSDCCEQNFDGQFWGDCAICCGRDAHNGCLLLGGLSSTTHLKLIAPLGLPNFNRDLRWCPTFSKLKTLLLNEWCVANDFRALVCILRHSPVLEKLTLCLAKVPTNTIESEGSFDPSEQLPAISEHLNLIEIKCAEVDERVWKTLRFLSRFAKQINIILPGSRP